MDVFEIRRNNLKELVYYEYGGNLSSFVRQLNQEYTRYNLALNGKIKVSDKMARNIEMGLNLKRGVFDNVGTFTRTAMAGAVQVTKYPMLMSDCNEEFVGDGIGSVFVSNKMMSELGVENHRLIAFTANNGSMEPVIQHNATLIIDTDDTVLIDGKLYLVAIDTHLEFRRIVRVIGEDKLLLQPESSKFHAEVVGVDNPKFRIIGRVVFQISVMLDE